MTNRLPELFSYIVPQDYGFAPNPYGGICTLACCKPPIRRYANVGDWVMGTSGAPDKGKLIYAMRVDRGLTFDLYWDFAEYACKKPGRNNGCGDNIYTMGPAGEFVQVKNLFHAEKHIKSDTSVNRVLISKTFYYFGAKVAEIPKEFKSLIHSTYGYKRIKPAAKNYDAVTGFIDWLQKTFKQGIHGAPALVKAKCRIPLHDVVADSRDHTS